MVRHTLKNIVAFAARFLKCAGPVWDIMHLNVQTLKICERERQCFDTENS